MTSAGPKTPDGVKRLRLARGSLLLAATLAMLAGLTPAGAAGGLPEVERKLGAAKGEREALQASTAGLLGELEAIDRRAAAARIALEAAEKELAAAAARRRRAEGALVRLDAEHQSLRRRMLERALGLHRLSRRGLGPLLFASGEAGARHRRYLDAILARDQEILAAVLDNRAAARGERETAVAAEKSVAESRRARAKAVAAVAAERVAKDGRLASLRAEGAEKDRLIGELEAAATRLREILRSRPPPLRREAPARKPPPRKPPAVGNWRPPLERLGKIESVRNGVEIEAALGASVIAVADGRVVFADWFPGYGRLLVLDHGGHWHSVYGYVDSLGVEPGDEVAAGQVIARVGTTGTARRPSLYFEVRRRGEPHDPLTVMTAGRSVEKAEPPP